MSEEEPQLYSEDLAVSEVKEIVERALSNGFGMRNPVPSARKWKGKMSVFEERVHPDVLANVIRGDCYPVSQELERALCDEGQSIHLGHATSENFSHTYLVAERRGHQIIIDPTIVQFIEKHRHVFVGTVDHLRSIVLNDKEAGLSEEEFESIWGINAIRKSSKLNLRIQYLIE